MISLICSASYIERLLESAVKNLCLSKNAGIFFIISCSLILVYGGLCHNNPLLKEASAGSGHEDCSSCHNVHKAKDMLLFFKEIKSDIQNPHTKKEMDKIDALCLMCHTQPPLGEGIRVIDHEKKHPFGINTFLVKLPDQAKSFWGKRERLSCIGCHDPHPSNENLLYLRTPKEIKVQKQEDVFLFCHLCHPDLEEWIGTIPKIDPKGIKQKGQRDKKRYNPLGTSADPGL